MRPALFVLRRCNVKQVKAKCSEMVNFEYELCLTAPVVTGAVPFDEAQLG